jgi:hypothetical protein
MVLANVNFSLVTKMFPVPLLVFLALRFNSFEDL